MCVGTAGPQHWQPQILLSVMGSMPMRSEQDSRVLATMDEDRAYWDPAGSVFLAEKQQMSFRLRVVTDSWLYRKDVRLSRDLQIPDVSLAK